LGVGQDKAAIQKTTFVVAVEVMTGRAFLISRVIVFGGRLAARLGGALTSLRRVTSSIADLLLGLEQPVPCRPHGKPKEGGRRVPLAPISQKLRGRRQRRM
jgi:hypothetical protein